jgi:two-component system, OmpR family, phosphate regulon sensor histidine kinase PhoR
MTLVYGILIGLIVAILAVAMGTPWIVRRRWTRPLRMLGRHAEEMATADWLGQAPVYGAPEVRRLIRQFNQVAAETHLRLADLLHERADLRALVDTMPDPILASDRQGKLIIMNSPAAQLLLLSPREALGQKVVSAISDEQVVELFEDVAALPDNASPPAPMVQREIRLTRSGQKMTCQAVAARTAGGGALVVLRDVSTLARAMQMKTDFVANASHELRTPITAIKIAFETMREAFEDDPGQVDRCLTVIDGNLQRLEEMLRDLLDLSRVEGSDLGPAMAVKSADLFNVVRGTMLPMAQQKKVDLIFEEPTAQELLSDARLLNLILKNLVENSVKYTPAGGKVTVRLAETADETGPKVALIVTDTGIGIAPEHIDRVFERFYQVDSARSGSAGRGTGLGLAIVKHAVNAMGGSVKLESTVGLGTTVTCLFPQPESVPAETLQIGENE